MCYAILLFIQYPLGLLLQKNIKKIIKVLISLSVCPQVRMVCEHCGQMQSGHHLMVSYVNVWRSTVGKDQFLLGFINNCRFEHL